MALLPGWDSDAVIPRGVIDDEKADLPQEPKGYFARLSSHRTSGGGGAGAGDAHGPSLSRASAPVHVARSATMSAAAAAAAIGTKGMPPPMSRTSSMPYGSPGSHAAASAGLLQPHKYQVTDWASELATLGGGKHPPAKGGAPAEPHQGGGKHHAGAWWRALEIGQLNERPELEPAGGGKHGAAGEHAAGAHASSFMPQLLPNKQKLDFGAGGGGAGASEGERI
ncbi:hypothetical protein CHLRE_03g179941v5 [Chlamydomonas reinhardtii]|uniref:Uncharacterized protein n=1 Tax=Chlamydomonas reinhardtii TaxID=3055 RepID=A8IDG9_CHLRE|nr:uncharacterized protein CHLRE_03g179941v5 [Chlamydomonas reinhardtii]PNW85299.1 hypothetical protein CHLRE_03g179941v5 [Chlamydomonas reinhardtii]|eukprot:XP_001703406.1 hypothetical protein CHLREDRAFT_205593 [Chlamydomonas reinhardtii]